MSKYIDRDFGISIGKFLNGEVKEYAIHTIKERALPSVIDGLKPVQRKIVFTANKVAKSPMKTSDLMGYISAVGGYDKGPMSLPSAITNMVQHHPGANNIPLLEGEGTFGSRLYPNGAAAERYTATRIHKNFEKYFKDFELCEYKLQDEKIYEPNHFLPVLPMILLNPLDGIATGFACTFIPYKKEDVIENMKLWVQHKLMNNMNPDFEGFHGAVWRDWNVLDKRKWYTTGIWNVVNTSTIGIKELPIGTTLEKYKSHLNNLIEKGEIKDYTDLSDKNGFLFEIACTREKVQEYIDMDPHKFDKIFKLTNSITENLKCISDRDTLLEFNNPNEIIRYFVKHRLLLMDQKKKYHIARIKREIDVITLKSKFIKEVMNGKISMKFKSRKDMIDILKGKGYKEPESLIEMNIYSINQEHLDKLKVYKIEKIQESEYYNETTPEQMILSDLEKL